jgi:signal transduction histidine kinase/ActR/RegA family two-component response regulator
MAADKRATERARELEASAEELSEDAPCAYLSTLVDGTIIRANRTFLSWIASPSEPVVGTTRFQTLLTVGARMYYETHYAPLLQMQGFVHEIALEMRRADGTAFPVVASARQIRDPHGPTLINRIALFDSTDRRGYEREIIAARKEAEESARALARADRQKNEFIAMLAHELRNPLAPIRSAVEIFRRSQHESPLLTETTSMMERQVSQMARLVEDLFDVSKIGQDKLSLIRVPVDLASVIHHATEMSEPLLRLAGLEFSMTLPAAAIYIEADSVRLAQAIGNILNNAAKFTPRGGSVALGLRLDGTAAVIHVKDTGIGIAPEQLSHVFELFMQENVLLEQRDGLGIGLSIAKSLIERHEGTLAVSSEGRGKGAEFTIRLPTLTEAPESVQHTPSREAPAAAAVVVKRILVVDDNHDSAQMMSLLLEFFGHDVRIAHDGLEAVEAAAVFQPHLVLLDIGLPKMNGYEAAERIRLQAGIRPTLVALTGWGQDVDRNRSDVAGFDAHLLKPVDHDVLMKLIADLPAEGVEKP